MVLEPQDEQAVKDIFARWGVEATVVGKVTGDNIYRLRDGDDVIAEVPVKALTDSPVWYPEQREPEYYQKLRSWKPDGLPIPEDLGIVLSQLLASPNIASKEWVYNQFDHTALLNTVIGPGADAAVLRIKGTPKGLP